MKEKSYERVRHFHGQRLEVRDFEDEQQYHMERRRIHQRLFHGPGVVTGFLGDLHATALGRGDLSLVIDPGVACNGLGQDIFLPRRVVIAVDLNTLRLPQTVYLVIRRTEEPADFVEDPEQPEYKGHRRVRERASIEVVGREPDPEREVELARVRLGEGTQEIRDAAHRDRPETNEIDLRFVPVAACAATAPPDLVHACRSALGELASVSTLFISRYELPVFREIRLLIHQARCSTLPPLRLPHLAEGLTLLLSLLQEAVDAIALALPRLHSSAHLQSIAARLDAAPDTFSIHADSLHRATRLVREIHEDLTRFLAEAPMSREEGWAPADLETIKVRSAEFPEVLIIGGKRLRLVDQIDVADTVSEEEHRFRLMDFDDAWSMRREFYYPDGALVVDRGRAQVGGVVRFNVRHLEPGKDLLVIRRIDTLRCSGVAELEVDGMKVPERWVLTGRDALHRWRNCPMGVPAGLISSEEVEICFRFVEAERGMEFYRLWFYQSE
ncbi:MAG: hypothetical protein O6952_01350 [Planctomycetota bacterium]|nr:hypothetical protein [Planctomycetota bacterium]